ncbi:unnamed protein product, partial [Prorocentrum cordatum]
VPTAWCSHAVFFCLGLLARVFVLPAGWGWRSQAACEGAPVPLEAVSTGGECVWPSVEQFRLLASQLARRITLLDAPPGAAVVLTVGGDSYEEPTVADADVLEMRPPRGLGAPLFGVAELSTNRFAAAPVAVAMWARLRAATMLRGVPVPASPFALAAGAGGGAAWVPQCVQLDDRAGATVMMAVPLAAPLVGSDAAGLDGAGAVATALGMPVPPAAAPAAAPVPAAAYLAAAAAAAGAGGAAMADCRGHLRVRRAEGRRAPDSASAALLAAPTPQAEAMRCDADSIGQQHVRDCRLLELGCCHDQGNCAKVASHELIGCQIQLIEGRHCEDAVTAQVAAEDMKRGRGKSAKAASASLLAVEAGHYAGATAGKGPLCIAPALTDVIVDQLETEAAIAKE